MATPKPLAIVNPQSGGGRTGKTLDATRAVIEKTLGAIDVAVTERPRHAEEIAERAANDGRDLVIAVGGDGTFNEVANGLLRGGARERGAPAAAIIGQGTGGDFRRALGIEHRLDRYVEAIASGRTRTVDVGRITYRAKDGATRERYFVNILSAGMGGLVDQYVADASRALGGKAAYFGASVRALVRCEEGHLRCDFTSGGETVTKRLSTYMIAICNGRFFGSGMDVAPMAKVDDGVLEVVSIGAPSKLAFAMSARRIYDAAHLDSPHTQHFACERISMDLENASARDVFLLDCDGEPIGGLPITVEIVPRALTVRC